MIRAKVTRAEAVADAVGYNRLASTNWHALNLLGHYYEGVNFSVVRNFQPCDTVHRDETAKVMRVERLSNDKWGVAIRIL